MSDASKENHNNGCDEKPKTDSNKNEQEASEVTTRISDHEAMMNEKRRVQQSRGIASTRREPIARGRETLKVPPPMNKNAEKQTSVAGRSLSGELMHALSEGTALRNSKVDNSSDRERLMQEKLGEMMQYKSTDPNFNWDDRGILGPPLRENFVSTSSKGFDTKKSETNTVFACNEVAPDGNQGEEKLSAHEMMMLEKKRIKNEMSQGVRRRIEEDQKLKSSMKKAPVQMADTIRATASVASSDSHGGSTDSDMMRAKNREKANRMEALGVATRPGIAWVSRDTRAASQLPAGSIHSSHSIEDDQRIKSTLKNSPIEISATSGAVARADGGASSSGTDITQDKNREKANRLAAIGAGNRPGVAWINHPSQSSQLYSQRSMDSSKATSVESNEEGSFGVDDDAVSKQRIRTSILPSTAPPARVARPENSAEDHDRMIREKRAAAGQLFDWATGITRDAHAASDPTVTGPGPSTASLSSWRSSSTSNNSLPARTCASDPWAGSHNEQQGESRGRYEEKHFRSYLREGLGGQTTSSMQELEQSPSVAEVSSGLSYQNSRTLISEQAPVAASSTCDLATNEEVSVHTDHSNPEIEAQVGLPVIFPGAFAIIGMDHENEEGYISADIQSVSTDHVDDDLFMDEDLEEQASDKEITEDAPFEATLAEAAVTVEGAVIQNDDKLDKKTLRRLRTMQYSIFIFALCAVALVTTSVLGRFSSVTAEKPMPVVEGWTMVGSTVFGPIDEARTEFGTALDMTRDGKKMAVVAPGRDDGDVNNVGALYIFTEKEGPNGTNWELLNENMKGPGAQKSTFASLTMSTDSVYIAVGYPDYENGAVMIYKESQATNEIEFDAQLEINTTEPSWFGYSVDLSRDGNILIIGAPRSSIGGLAQSGAVHVFQRSGSEWAQLGEIIVGEEQDEFSGWSVSVVNSDGIRVAVGSPVFADFTGKVRVFDWTGSSWEQVGESLEGEGDLNRYGDSVDFSEDGRVLAVGARGTFYESPGYVTIFREEEGSWVLQGERIYGKTDGDGFGADVALSKDGNVVAVGAPLNEDFGKGSGSIRVFEFDTTLGTWEQVGSPIGGRPRGGYGSSVAIDDTGMRVAGGAPISDFDERITRAGGVGIFDRIP